MFTYWYDSLELQISAMPAYLKVSNNTTSGKHSSNHIGVVLVSVILFTASLRSCWARVILLTNAFPRDWAFTKYFSFSLSQLRCHLVKFLRQEAHKHASLHDVSTLKQFFTSSTIFSTILYSATTICDNRRDNFFGKPLTIETFQGLYFLYWTSRHELECARIFFLNSALTGESSDRH